MKKQIQAVVSSLMLAILFSCTGGGGGNGGCNGTQTVNIGKNRTGVYQNTQGTQIQVTAGENGDVTVPCGVHVTVLD